MKGHDIEGDHLGICPFPAYPWIAILLLIQLLDYNTDQT